MPVPGFVFSSAVGRGLVVSSRRACWNCEKKLERFCGGFFQAVVEIIKKKAPKATLIDFHSGGSFHRLPLPNVLSFYFFFFLVKIRPSTRKCFAPGWPTNDDRQPGRSQAWPDFCRGFLSGLRFPCGLADAIPPQDGELVQRLSPMSHSVPLPVGHDVFQGHV